ncbi:MAG: DUF6786 family protein [Balneolaceae bacterium]
MKLMKTTTGILLIIIAMNLSACSPNENENRNGTFGYDVQFLEKYTDVLVLKGENSDGQVLVTPTMQGRVMTSTVDGENGKSLGWINHELIESGEILEQFTPYGGEDRFWIAPEGGQYSVFITPGEEMEFENWYVPKGLNTEPWNLISQSETQVTVQKSLNLTNHSNTNFDLDVSRTLKIHDKNETENLLGITIPEEIKLVSYESENTIQNTGNEAWTKETGTISIWILSMFTPAPGITVVVPYEGGSVEELGPVVITDYFGEIGSDRLSTEDEAIYFRIDGEKRQKLGVSPRRALPFAGSYDETNNMLTIINYTLPEDNTDYLNQLWEEQENPYEGEVVFAYNDGPLDDGSQLGPFYELESSSPAAFLDPEESLTHHHRVFHFAGDEEVLNQISQEVLGVSIEEIKTALPD